MSFCLRVFNNFSLHSSIKYKLFTILQKALPLLLFHLTSSQGPTSPTTFMRLRPQQPSFIPLDIECFPDTGPLLLLSSAQHTLLHPLGSFGFCIISVHLNQVSLWLPSDPKRSGSFEVLTEIVITYIFQCSLHYLLSLKHHYKFYQCPGQHCFPSTQ